MIEGKLAQANGRLKAAKVGCSIEAIGNRPIFAQRFPLDLRLLARGL
ncbi:hypothetical protein IQ268_23250 [Oculatella sp. LEGE 06141]|nr:hypothetical protein [Oculatella sp. LEGE 06141]MBE9181483.1 hypothetical protein [Oculatella sp. LEGE 06141]